MEITATGTAHEHAHSGGHDHAHEELGFLRTWVFSLDHKVIGIQYAVTGLLFLLFGFTLMMIMRFQMAYPGHPIPVIGEWFGAANAPGGILLPEFYNQLGAMHGTIMVFLGVVKRIDAPHSDSSSAVRMTTDGIEMIIVVTWKNALMDVPMPVMNMWCAQTMNDMKPRKMIE